MASVWFAIVGLLLAAYVALDGFDLGAGAIHLWVARTDSERRAVIGSVGPFWDGNEVFLLAAGGALFVAFPRVLASAVSGLYLGVILVIWALILRGISIELRNHLRDGLWRAFWDVLFSLSSGTLALLLGVALGNVLRGFPLQPDGYFELELFSLASPREARGIVDAYTLATGVFGFVVLVAHGARFVAMRTTGPVQARSTRLANRAMPIIALAWVLVTWLSWIDAHDAVALVTRRPEAILVLVVAAAAFAASWQRGSVGAVRSAFLASVTFVLALVDLAAATTYPVMLRSTNPAAPSLTIETAAAGSSSLAAALRWWPIAAVLVVVYFVNLFRVHRGTAGSYGEGEEGDTGA